MYILFIPTASYTLIMKNIAKTLYTFTILSLISVSNTQAGVPIEVVTWYPDLKKVGELLIVYSLCLFMTLIYTNLKKKKM